MTRGSQLTRERLRTLTSGDLLAAPGGTYQLTPTSTAGEPMLVRGRNSDSCFYC